MEQWIVGARNDPSDSFRLSGPALTLFLLLLLSAGSEESGNIREQESSPEDQSRAQPVVGSEGVIEVHDGEEETEELPECDHQRDGETGALRGQHKHGGDADVLGEDVAEEVEQHDGELDVEEREGDRLTREENVPVVENVGSQQQEAGQREGVSVEQSLLRVFAVLAIDNLGRRR